MNTLQKLFTTLLPKRWAEDMEAESRAWHIKCGNCGYERSVWDMGGIRWKAAGNPNVRQRCPNCGQVAWHRIYRPQ